MYQAKRVSLRNGLGCLLGGRRVEQLTAMFQAWSEAVARGAESF